MVNTPDLLTPFLPVQERDLVLNRFNDTRSVYPCTQTVIDLFEAQVKRTPDAIAVVYGNVRLSYNQLNAEVNKLARYLHTHYVLNKDEIVGVALTKSHRNLISMLAVLKAGAACLPIDPQQLMEQIAYIIGHSKLKLLIHDGNADFSTSGVKLVNINSLKPDNKTNQYLRPHQSPDDLAYVIYTAGNAGKPTGVMIEHRGCVNMAMDQIKLFDITSKDRITWFASVAADVSVSEILMALFSGATLLIPQDDVTKDEKKLADYIQLTGATVVTIPPGCPGFLPRSKTTELRCIITSGKNVSVQKAAHFPKHISRFNVYGVPECSVWVCAYKITSADAANAYIPVGKPLANLSVYILDHNLQPVPVGVEGQVYVAGIGLARGYLNNAMLTRKKFIPCPFQHGQRMFHTGHAGKWLPNGNIEL